MINMINKKLIAIFLAAIVLISPLISACGEKADTPAPGQQTEDPASAETTEEAETEIPDSLPEKDYGGYVFRELMTTDTETINTYIPEEENGEVLNDAIYRRNQQVSERFNVEFQVVPGGAGLDKLNGLAKKAIMAGSDDFDISFEHVIYGPNSTLEGLYMNLFDLPYLDFSKPWWPANTVDELSLNGKIFLGSGNIAPTAIDGSKVIVVNKDKVVDLGMEVPYQKTLDGLWTMDALIGMTAGVYDDLNGNGERDFEDFYGYTTQPHQNGFIVSCDCSVLKKTDGGGLEIDAYGEKMVWLVETLYDWYYESGDCWITSTDQKNPESFINSFNQGHSLFSFAKIDNVRIVFRYGDINYGILPLPKADEKQDTYRTFAHDTFMCVPVTTTDVERTSVIVEALSAEGYKQVTPVFYEIVLKEKLAYDAETIKMLEIINDTRAISFAYVYDNWEGYGHLFSAIFSWDKKGKRDYTSFYESRLKSAEKRAVKIVAGFADG